MKENELKALKRLLKNKHIHFNDTEFNTPARFSITGTIRRIKENEPLKGTLKLFLDTGYVLFLDEYD